MADALRLAYASASDARMLQCMLSPGFPGRVVAWLDYSGERRAMPGGAASGRDGERRRGNGPLAARAIGFARRLARRAPSVTRVAQEAGLARLPAFAAGPEAIAEFLREHRVDVLVACTCPLLPAGVLAGVRLAAINVHPSLLPAWRGGAPGFWQSVRGETGTGVTVHLIDAGVDTGAILAQRRFTVPAGVTRGEFEAIAFAPATGGAALAEALASLAALPPGGRPGIVQPAGSPTPAARNVSPARLLGLLAEGQLAPEEAWRAMRYFDGHEALVLPEVHRRDGFVWHAAGFDDRVEVAPGTVRVQRSPRGRWLLHPRGRVRIALRPDPIRVARMLWRKMTRR